MTISVRAWPRLVHRADTPLYRIARLGLWVLVFTFPWQQTLELGPIGALSKLVGAIVLPIGFAAVVSSGRRRALRDFEQVTLWFTAVVVASFFWTIDDARTSTTAMAMVQMAALVLLVREFAPGKRGVRFLGSAFVAGCWIPVLQSIYGNMTDAPLVDGRLRLGEMHPNDVAFVLTLALPVAWWLATDRSHQSTFSARQVSILRNSCYLFMVLGLFAIVLTGSRAGLLGSAVALIVVPWHVAAKNPRRGLVALVVLVALAPVVVSVLPEEQTDRLATIESEVSDGTLNNRTTLWSAAWATWGDNLVTGVGAGASRVELGERTGIALGAHNTPLSVAAELGVLGLAPFLLCLLVAVRRSLGATGRTRRFAVIMSATLLFGLQFRHWDYEKPTWLFLALLAAVGTEAATTGPTDHVANRQRRSVVGPHQGVPA